MCRKCLAAVRPNRGNMCLEGGHYLLNFAGCAACHAGPAATAPCPGRRAGHLPDPARHADRPGRPTH